MEIRALFWDVDDTILDFEGYVKETMRGRTALHSRPTSDSSCTTAGY